MVIFFKNNNNKEIVMGKRVQDWLQSTCFFYLEFLLHSRNSFTNLGVCHMLISGTLLLSESINHKSQVSIKKH